jgi:hypothetical protein
MSVDPHPLCEAIARCPIVKEFFSDTNELPSRLRDNALPSGFFLRLPGEGGVKKASCYE